MDDLIGIACNIENIIGVEKDIILINNKDFDRVTTLSENNVLPNGDLTNIYVKEGAKWHTIEGSDSSVKPSTSTSLSEDNKLSHIISLSIVIFNKSSKYRKIILELANSELVVILRDKSSKKFEIFGLELGLTVSGLSREVANENRFNVSLTTPESKGLKETFLPKLVSGEIFEFTPVVCSDNGSGLASDTYIVNKTLTNITPESHIATLNIDWGDGNLTIIKETILPYDSVVVTLQHTYDSGGYTITSYGVCNGSVFIEVGILLDESGIPIWTEDGETIYT